MIPTPIGAVVVLLGLWLLFRPSVEMLVFVLAASLLPGASAIDAPVLGHSSIPPAMVALGFLGLRLLRRDIRESPAWPLAFGKNAWLLAFCIYGAVTAFILPRIFADRIDLIPMGHSTAGYLPLQPSSQNITQAVYLIGTAFAGLAGTAISTRPRSVTVLISAMIVLTWIQVGTGVADLLASAAHMQGLFDIFRNGAYAELSQDAGDFHRISGLTPEPSSYAGLSAIFMVFMVELWIRGIRSAQTGIAGLAMLALMLLSTSSTAYGVAVIYGLILIVRSIVIPGSIPLRKSAALLGVGGLIGAVGIGLVLVKPGLVDAALSTVGDLTLHKTESLSGLERGLWARQGWDAFKLSRGLGVGVGSFRSSSLVMAVLGSIGPAGLIVLGGYCLQVLRPSRRATYLVAGAPQTDVGACAGWTALMSLVPAAFSAPSADPGTFFAITAGLALGWRSSISTTREQARALTPTRPAAVRPSALRNAERI